MLGHLHLILLHPELTDYPAGQSNPTDALQMQRDFCVRLLARVSDLT